MSPSSKATYRWVIVEWGRWLHTAVAAIGGLAHPDNHHHQRRSIGGLGRRQRACASLGAYVPSGVHLREGPVLEEIPITASRIQSSIGTARGGQRHGTPPRG